MSDRSARHSSSSSSSSSSSPPVSQGTARRCCNTAHRIPSAPPALVRSDATAHASFGHNTLCCAYTRETRTSCCVCGVVDFIIDYLAEQLPSSDSESESESQEH